MDKISQIESIKLLKFSENKTMKKEELSNLFNCSGRTIQRKLKQWQAIRSYNQNGQYYALLSVVKFDTSGLWRYNSVCFSKYGNLRHTITTFVNESPAGMAASEISSTLKLKEKSFLTFFKNISEIQREKIANTYVYFSINETVYQSQKENRIRRNEELPDNSLTDTMIILILVEKIKNPDLDELAISKKLEKQGVRVNSLTILGLFKQHGIEKKTSDLR